MNPRVIRGTLLVKAKQPIFVMLFKPVIRILFHLLAAAAVISSACAQNLVVNGSFDDSISNVTPGKFSTKMTAGHQLTKAWYQVGGSVDFYNSDLSRGPRKTKVHKARSSQARIALVLGEDPGHSRWTKGYREFAQTRLAEPLKKDAIYSVNFYIVRDNRSVFHASEIGALFGERPEIAGPTYSFAHAAQVKTSSYETLASSDRWQLVHGYYRAKGGEQYLTIGNFGDPIPQVIDGRNIPPKLFRNDYGWYAYYYLDDVVVYEVADSISDKPAAHMPASPEDMPYNNVVFVLDVSGSMQKDRKIEKLKSAVSQFLNSLPPNEVISVVTFDASPRVLARRLPAMQASRIMQAIDTLEPGGGTNVNAAIWKAYQLIDSAYIPGGNNRVILVTDAGYEVSDHSHQLITGYADNKSVAFSTIVFNDKKFPRVKRICEQNGGSYNSIGEGDAALALKKEAKTRKIAWYGPGRRKKFTYFTVRLVLVGILAGILAWRAVR